MSTEIPKDAVLERQRLKGPTQPSPGNSAGCALRDQPSIAVVGASLTGRAWHLVHTAPTR
ncbi:hypothetical protein [Nonomuraea sp. NPDC049709]|uniref:hypothetical protein n=1 Tax=Nonomuraea sp. NPDC049709 TaxID=3154736 RepID=UPI0034425164